MKVYIWRRWLTPDYDRLYHWVELEEKDTAYRSTLIEGFAKKSKKKTKAF